MGRPVFRRQNFMGIANVMLQRSVVSSRQSGEASLRSLPARQMKRPYPAWSRLQRINDIHQMHNPLRQQVDGKLLQGKSQRLILLLHPA